MLGRVSLRFLSGGALSNPAERTTGTSLLRQIRRGCRFGGIPVAFAALGTLVLEHGFPLSSEWVVLGRELQRILLWALTLLLLVSVFRGGGLRSTLRSRWLDLTVLVLALLVLLLPESVLARALGRLGISDPGDLASAYLDVTQVLLVAAVIPEALRYSRRLMRLRINPSVLILMSFFLAALAGALALMLPRAVRGEPLGFLEALFMSTSAVSVTGLSVVDPATRFSPLGQGILLALIQIGGLGIMTLTTFFAQMLMGQADLKTASSVEHLLADSSLSRARATVGRIALLTFGIEALGSVVLYYHLPPEIVPEGRRGFFSVFHSVSAFCNAGFALTSLNLADPAVRDAPGVLLPVAALITLGGLGFPVYLSLWGWVRTRLSGLRLPLNLHTKIVLATSLVLVVAGTLGIWVLETGRIAGSSGRREDALHALFQAVSARTAGFNSIDFGAVTPACLLLVMFLMWIGGSPASTAGGIRTTTLTLALLTLRSMVRGGARVEIFRREISQISIGKAFSTMLLSVLLIGTAFFVMLILEDEPFHHLAFEVVSAVGTVGLSTGITPNLSSPGKAMLILLMLVGRAGLLGTVAAFVPLERERQHDFPKEDVLV